ncbi:ABC transporter ATP-binding protein [Pararhodobacter sp. SW119]|uniref:ABC transporter ATP-binding protein n=1 Tax=Pararhodobacter sp. SW119 TaxID=2780075 RepID=UPI001AE04D17|nr:ABC transporter ATP-binding protein [Pararhodobacter sp. SW119]
MALLTLSNLYAARGPCDVLHDISLSVAAGEFVGLLGPNGAGKTTLMRAALGLMQSRGQSNLAALDRRARARAVAWLPQAREIAWPMDVETVITLGRAPHLAPGQCPGAEDRVAIDAAITRMGLDGFRTRIATQLSGGEQARVLIARALAQDTPLLMADEPTAGLDPGSQIGLMELFAQTAREGRAVVASLHDLGLAVRHCTRVVVLDRGRIAADGAPDAVMSPDLLARVFHITAHFASGPEGPVFQPLGLIR